jgi:steroid delta-isomerase-like uncharacterized protein
VNDKEIVKAFYDEINRGDYEAYDRYCHADFEDFASHGHFKGRDSVKQMSMGMHHCFADIHFTVDEVLQEGPSVAVRGRMSGRQTAPFFGLPSHGKQFEITFCGIYHVQDGRITRRYINGDDQGMARQLGWIPSPTHEVRS